MFDVPVFDSTEDRHKNKTPGPSFSKNLKSVTMVTCLSPKFIHPN